MLLSKMELLELLENKIPESALCTILVEVTNYKDNFSLRSNMGQPAIIPKYEEEMRFIVNCNYILS